MAEEIIIINSSRDISFNGGLLSQMQQLSGKSMICFSIVRHKGDVILVTERQHLKYETELKGCDVFSLVKHNCFLKRTKKAVY